MKLEEMSPEEILSKLQEEFDQTKLAAVNHKLDNLIHTSETMDQLIARVNEAVNVALEESYLKVNKDINRLDTRKDSQ